MVLCVSDGPGWLASPDLLTPVDRGMEDEKPSLESIYRAAQAWCEPETQHLEMIPELAMVFAKILDEATPVVHKWNLDAG